MTHAPIPPDDAVMIPDLCERHLSDLVRRRLRMHDHEPWRAAVVVAQLLLFTWTTGDRRFLARTEERTENFSLVLAEIGCLACFDRAAYGRVCRLMRKLGVDGAARVAQQKASDPDWPIEARSRGEL